MAPESGTGATRSLARRIRWANVARLVALAAAIPLAAAVLSVRDRPRRPTPEPVAPPAQHAPSPRMEVPSPAKPRATGHRPRRHRTTRRSHGRRIAPAAAPMLVPAPRPPAPAPSPPAGPGGEFAPG